MATVVPDPNRPLESPSRVPSASPRSRAEPVIPTGPSVVQVAEGAGLIAIVDPERIIVATVPEFTLRCEIGVDPDVAACEVAFVGPDRLLVLSRYASHTMVYLVDPSGPHKLAEVRIASPARLLAASADRALVGGPLVGGLGTAVISCAGDQLEVAILPMRAVPTCASGAGGEARFLVNVGGTFEEWDTQTRAPVRRFRLARPHVVRTLGCSANHLWWIANTDPTRLEVLPVTNRGQVRSHVLPEPIAAAVGHPDVDVVLAIGADSRRAYAIDVGGAGSPAQLGIDRVDNVALAIGKQVFAIIVARGRAPWIVALHVPVPGGAPGVTDSTGDADPTEPAGVAATEAAAPPAAEAIAGSPELADDDARDASTPEPVPSRHVLAAAELTTAQRLLEWRDRMRNAGRPAPRAAAELAAGAPTWRDELVTWGRSAVAGTHRDPPPWAPRSPLVSLARLGLPDDLVPGVALAYARYLTGARGVAPAELADLLGHRWDEALGRGQLASSGALIWRGNRIVLSPALAAVLDERQPVTGFVVGIARDRPRVTETGAVVALDLPLDIVAGRCAPLLGAVLVPRAAAAARTIQIEARLRGAVPILELDGWEATQGFGSVLVRVPTAVAAAALGLPVITVLFED